MSTVGSTRVSGRNSKHLFVFAGKFIRSKLIHVCCSLCILLVHAMFTRLYIFEYKFNYVDDVNTSIVF